MKQKYEAVKRRKEAQQEEERRADVGGQTTARVTAAAIPIWNGTKTEKQK